MSDSASLHRSRVAPFFLVALLAGCGGRKPNPGSESDHLNTLQGCDAAVTLSFALDTGGAAEAYVCFGFDADLLAGGTIGRIAWRPPPFAAGLHHGKLYAVAGDFPDGPVPCAGMPAGAVGLHVWAPGGDELILPSDTALQLPSGTRRLVVEAHVLRTAAGVPMTAAVSLCPGPRTPARIAAMMTTYAPVPAIRPRQVETSQRVCAISADVHLFSVWPHMHKIGTEIALELMRVDGTVTPLIVVSPWAFYAQRTYPLDVDARMGDAIRTRCVWSNDSDDYVLPGPLISDEMCNAGIIAWPALSASCATLN